MPCGCASTCGCNIVGGTGVTVDRIGDKFTINAPGSIQNVFIQEADPGPLSYPYVWWELDNLGNLVTVWIFTP